LRESNELLNRAILEELDRDQLITFLLAANERNNLLERKIIELTERVAELEARLKQDSSNTSKPPSSDGYPKPAPKSQRKKSGKKPGGQPNHKGHGKSMADKVTETIVITPQACPCCGEGLENVPGRKTDTRYVMEMPPIAATVTEYISKEKTCPTCGKRISLEFPNEAAASQQYGPNLKAFIVLLAETGMVAMNRVVEILEAVSGIQVSEGTVANTIEKCARSLEKPVESIKNAVKTAKVGHFDETGMRSQGKLKWLHTASTGKLTYQEIHDKRGKEAMDEIGVLSDFKGTAVHDCMPSYWKYNCVHSLCNAHLLRELTYIDETTGQGWAQEMIDLLLEVKKAVDSRRSSKNTSLPEVELLKYKKRYDMLVVEGLTKNPEQPKPAGRRGPAKQTKARLLVLRLEKRKEEYLRFAADFNTPFDNNQAERDFRMAKVKQKVSGCFRSDKGEKSFATIYSFIQTLKKNGVSVFNELVKVFKGDYSFPFKLTTE
jgi:transposase